jgi:hypothetical protein
MQESRLEEICRQYLDKLHYERKIIYWRTSIPLHYANNFCYLYEGTDSDHHIFKGSCRVCKQPITVEVLAEALHKYEQGGYIQDCMPMLSPDDREFLMSGTCGKCWDELFQEENDDETERS